MTDEELQAYATALITVHARNIEFLTIVEVATDFTDVGEISEEDANTVAGLIDRAKITVEFAEPDGEQP